MPITKQNFQGYSVSSQKNGVNFHPFNARSQSRKENHGLRAKIDKKMQKRGFYSKIFAALCLSDFALGFAPKY
jgi:hypothetical protein